MRGLHDISRLIDDMSSLQSKVKIGVKRKLDIFIYCSSVFDRRLFLMVLVFHRQKTRYHNCCTSADAMYSQSSLQHGRRCRL